MNVKMILPIFQMTIAAFDSFVTT